MVGSRLVMRVVLCLTALPLLGAPLLGTEQPRDGEFLSPDQAFAPSARAKSDGTVEVAWKIATGYYLYRQRMAFSTDTAGLQLGAARLPKGQIKTDEYFGEMEVYHDSVTATLTVSRPAGATSRLALTVKYQGCAEAGLCYNPMTKVLDIELPAVSEVLP